MSRGCKTICVEETADGGVVISALEVIEARFRIVVVSAVAQWIPLCIIQAPAIAAALDGGDVAPCVVAVLRIDRAALVVELHHVALGIEHVMEGVGPGQCRIVVAAHGERAACLVVEEICAADKAVGSGVGHVVPDNSAVLRHIFVTLAVYHLRTPHAGHVVLVAVGLAALGDTAQPAALCPGEIGKLVGSVVPTGGVQIACVGNTLGGSVYRNCGQSVGPVGITIGVFHGVGNNIVYLGFNTGDIARSVDHIRYNRGCRRRA